MLSLGTVLRGARSPETHWGGRMERSLPVAASLQVFWVRFPMSARVILVARGRTKMNMSVVFKLKFIWSNQNWSFRAGFKETAA